MSDRDAAVDRELSLRGILLFGLVLALLLAATGGLIWMLSGGLQKRLEATDPPPAVLPEARRQEPPPEPRLQDDPQDDMRAMRAEEERLLGTWGWVDETAGIARVPIERAIEIVARDGLTAPEPPPPTPPAGGGPGEE